MTRLALASRGDALTPYLFQALRRRFPVVGELSVDLTPVQRYVTAMATFRPTRSAWVERFYKSSLAFSFRSGQAARQLAALPDDFDLIFQIHALFEIPAAPSALYIDCTHRQSAEHWPSWNPLSGRDLERWYDRERESYQRAAHLFAFSEPTRQSLIHDYGVTPEKVSTTGAGANLQLLPDLTAPAARRLDSSAPTVLFVGNDFVRKGGPVLLEAFAQVRRAVPTARLQLVGTDPGIGRQDGVQVLGRINDRQVIERLYRQASVFTVPSHFDPFPLVLLEAMAYGLPTVSSSSCGIPEIVEDGVTGDLVPAGDADALAEALIGALRDPAAAARAGRAGRARVNRLYTWDAVVDRMAPALQSLSARSAA